MTLLGILSAATFGKGFDKAGLQLENDVASVEHGKEAKADITGSCNAVFNFVYLCQVKHI